MTPPVLTGLTPRAVGIVNAAFALAVLLHVDRTPLWCSGVALAILGWRQLAARRALPFAGKALRAAIALALTALIVLNFRTFNGLAAGSALLVVMGAAKLLELRTRRDALTVIAVALFLLLAACLDRQSLPRMPLYAATAWLACTGLAALYGAGEQTGSLRAAGRTAGGALLIALPLAAVAFLFFPRLPGGLWTLPADQKATTGLSDEMSPGSITELTDSDEPAFRVRFLDATPPAQERYWRGPVLHDFDGYTWRRLRGQTVVRPNTTGLGPVYRHRVTLEPHQQFWWFALDTVLASPRRSVMLTFDNQLLAERAVTQPVTYDATSQTQMRSSEPLSSLGRRYDLALPAGRNPRTLAYAAQLRSRAPDAATYIQAVLAQLRDGGFEYTLTPPRLDYDSIDDLLFNTKRGFCGHFASAFTTLMRAGGVPARVVTGYLGGEWNPVGGYFIVRQSDAHAWSEVWLDGRGWTRVDPTAVVSPERLTRGMYEVLRGSGSQASRLIRNSPLLTQLRSLWDAGGTWWRDTVLEFDLDAQFDLLERLGIHASDWRALATLLTAGVALWLGFLTWQLRRAPRALAGDPLTRAWRSLDRRLARAGLARLAHEPVALHMDRVALELPLHGPQLRALARRYGQLRYGSDTTDWPQRVAQLAAASRRVRLPRNASDRPAGLDAAQRHLLAAHLPVYARLPDELRERAALLTRQLLTRLRFVGCDGLQVTEEMRLVVAFQPCLMLANRGIDALGDLASVLLYPGEFLVHEEDVDEAGVVTVGSRTLSGQAIDTARIVLSWQDVLDGLVQDDDSAGYNVVLHEFAHHLDHVVDGLLSAAPRELVPVEEGGGSWHDVLAEEYAVLCRAVASGADSFIDPYGAEDPAEFFAVATETFFELPHVLAERHPRLFELLAQFFALDPRAWAVPPTDDAAAA